MDPRKWPHRPPPLTTKQLAPTGLTLVCRLTGQFFLTFAPSECFEVPDRHPAGAGRDAECGDWPCQKLASVHFKEMTCSCECVADSGEDVLSIIRKRPFFSIVRQGVGGLLEFEPEIVEVTRG